jgi:predicted phosphate transport protein (TIGR00153 family)
MMNNSFFSKFGPKEPKFFDFLKQVSETLLETSGLLMEALESTTSEDRKEYFHRIKEKERLGDTLSHKIFEKLSTSFITPFDREDIHLLADNLDDVIDRINSCAKRIAIYNPKKNNPYEKALGEIVRKDAECIDAAMAELTSVRNNASKLKGHCITLHDLENEGDDVYETAIIHLFEEEKDGIELIKMKEILNELEKATDAAEQVGKALKTIIVKYA